MINTVMNNLLDAGCSKESAATVERLCNERRLDDALHQMRVLRCYLMEDLHKVQRKVDCLDHLIRQIEKEIKATTERR